MLKSKKDLKVVVVGDTWTGPLFASELAKHGCVCELWLSEPPIAVADPVGIFIGNGERYEKATKIFGEQAAQKLWFLSECNWDKANQLFTDLGISFHATGMARSELKVKEKGAAFSGDQLGKTLRKKYPPSSERFFSRLRSVELSHKQYQLRFERGKSEERTQADLALVVTEAYDQKAIASLGDIRIPISLSSFQFPVSDPSRPAYALFNQGAEFSVQDDQAQRVGSYRNLFSDRGVGLQDEIDTYSRDLVLPYFSKLGWMDPAVPYVSCLAYESVSCDGFPVVGPAPGLPGVILATGFGARTACFVFEVAHRMAQSLVQGGADGLGIFSSRRFV